jgi:hypothetical protein
MKRKAEKGSVIFSNFLPRPNEIYALEIDWL